VNWNLTEAVDWYKKQGAPGDQNALLNLLREVQEEFGTIPQGLLPEIGAQLGVKESFLLAMIRRQPRLRLGDTHILEMCAGPNCGKRTELAALAEKFCTGRSDVTLKFAPCMRQCGKGPNLKWDGQLHNRADADLLEKLLNNK
jgi:NADH:ubiquinone oxidoreductase subunit E